MKLHHLLPTIVLFAVTLSCVSSTPRADSNRAPASITGLREVPPAAYFPMSNSKDFFRKWASTFNPKAQPEAYYFEGEAPHSETLERIFQDVVAGARAISGSRAPAPKLIIYKSSDENAFVMQAFSCVSSPVSIEGTSEESAEGIAMLFPNSGRGDIPMQARPLKENEELPKCLRMQSPELLRELASHKFIFNRVICTATMDGVRLKFQCPGQKQGLRISALMFTATVPLIFVSAGLVANVTTRDEFEAVVAHELGHYFLGHGNTFGVPNRSYFFRRTSEAPAFRPPHDPQFQKLSLTVRTIGNLNSGEPQEPYYTHSLSAEMFFEAMTALAKDHDAFARNGLIFNRDICGRALLDEEYKNNLIDAIKVRSPSPAQRLKIRQAFEIYKPCALSLKRAGGDADFLEFYGSRIESPNNAVAEFLYKDNMPSPSSNAWEAFVKLDRAVKAALESPAMRENINELGFYTDEEEADVFALNYLKASGLDILAMSASVARLGKAILKHPPVLNQDLAECVAAFDNHWMKDGKPYRPTFADFSDPHHDICFRMRYLEEMVPRIGDAGAAAVESRHADAFFPPVARDYKALIRTMPEYNAESFLVFR